MRRLYKILIPGAVIFVVGIGLLALTFYTLKQTSYSINTSYDPISPGKAVLKETDLSAGVKMSLVVDYQPSGVPMNVRVIQIPAGPKILDLNFSHRLFASFTPNEDGLYAAVITNLGSQQQVSVTSSLGTSSLFNANGQPNVPLQAIAIAGIVLPIVGFIVLFIGGVILVKDKLKRRRGNKNKE
jgi:hypothetical protein